MGEISYFPVEVQSVMGQSFSVVNDYLGELSDFNAVVVVGNNQDGRKPRNVETLDIVEEEESYAPAEVLSIMTQTSQFLNDPYGLPSVFEDVWLADRNEEGETVSRGPRNVEIDDGQEEPYIPIEVKGLMGQTLDLSDDPYDFTSVFEEVSVSRGPRKVEIDDGQEEPYIPIEVQSLMGQTLDLGNDPYDFTSVFEEVWVGGQGQIEKM